MGKFKKGHVITCIRAEGYPVNGQLTNGKSYTVLYLNDNDSLYIHSDSGDRRCVFAFRFKLLELYPIY